MDQPVSIRREIMITCAVAGQVYTLGSRVPQRCESKRNAYAPRTIYATHRTSNMSVRSTNVKTAHGGATKSLSYAYGYTTYKEHTATKFFWGDFTLKSEEKRPSRAKLAFTCCRGCRVPRFSVGISALRLSRIIAMCLYWHMNHQDVRSVASRASRSYHHFFAPSSTLFRSFSIPHRQQPDRKTLESR